MGTTTVRVDNSTHRRLRDIAEQSDDLSYDDVIAKALDVYEREKFFDAYDEAYEQLRADEDAWEEAKEERALWENTVGDGADP